MRLAEKKEGFLSRHRFFILIFLYQALYHALIVNRLSPWRLNELTYSLYCVDFSYGFASKLLPGAVFNLIFGSHAGEKTAEIYSIAVVLIIFLFLSALLERFLLRIPPENRRSASFLLLFFLSGAYTFAIYTKWLGMLDTYWLLFSLLFFFLLEHRRLRFLIPAVYVLSLMIHFSALVFFLTFFSIVLLFRISVTEEKRERTGLWAVFAVSLGLTAVCFVFLLMFESQTLCSVDEFRRKLTERGTDYHFYFEYAFYRLWNGESFIPESVYETRSVFMRFLYLFYYQVKLDLMLFEQNTANGLITSVGGTVILSPALFFILRFHRLRMRGNGNRLKCFCHFLMIVQFPFVFVLGLLFAIGIDMTRYLTHGFLVLLSCLLAVLYYDGEARAQFFEKMNAAEVSLPAKIYFTAYAAMALLPCY